MRTDDKSKNDIYKSSDINHQFNISRYFFLVISSFVSTEIRQSNRFHCQDIQQYTYI